MPLTLDLLLPAPAVEHGTPARLHAVACSLLEGEGGHRTQVKPWTAWPLRDADATGVAWRLTWLADGHVPPAMLEPPLQLRLGPADLRVHRAELAAVEYEEVAQAPPAGGAGFHLVTPTYFNREGTDVVLPEPTLLLGSLLRRWNLFAPAPLRFGPEDRGALLEHARVSQFDLRTVRTSTVRGVPRRGAVGSVEVDLPRRSPTRSREVLGVLTAAAELLGAGRATTSGSGVVLGRPKG
ncbi:CRISPR system precrRNA processing endoribonuclease RAMP protein Cas6 [Cellulomonas bogoriensis]|nr:CRISPR system precrRNA processing endoribonuclease RAMP protein Cas6 [Cellulomonas bogoriensis]